VSGWWDIPARTFRLEWTHVNAPSLRCAFRFSGVLTVEIQSPEEASTLEGLQTLSDLVYQALDPARPFIKFWFMDETTIKVTAASLFFEGAGK
jgi:hypothetical protein